jgi:RPA family protein
MASIKRETAMICMIESILQGSFVRTEGWNPSYFSTDLGDISRVNIIGVVVSNEIAGGVLVDDGSGRILLRSFEGNLFGELSLGDLVLIIGRPRVYNEQKYLLPEIIKKVNHGWGAYRQLQLEILKKKAKAIKKESRIILNEKEKPVNYFQKIVEFVKDLDDGSGADVSEVIKRADAPKGEEFVQKLIEEGELFEVKPGRIKVLE